jgi:ribose transport system substrate-binding protein
MTKLSIKACVAACIGVVTIGLSGAANAQSEGKPDALPAVSKSFLWNNGPIAFVDTTKFKKPPPYTIGFSNASVSNLWALGYLHAMERAAEKNKGMIKKLIVTDANDNPTKQVADIQDLMQRGVDILIVRPATESVDAAVNRAAKQGIPVILGDRRTPSDNYVSYLTVDDWAQGRNMAQWMVEKLNGKGNVVLLAGMAGASPAEARIKAANEVFKQYPGIKVLDTQYTDWSPAKGKTVMAALIQKYGKDINGVWADHGLQASGGIEAFTAAGYKPGEIPPFTCADLNACWVNAIKNKVPMMSLDNPPAGGAAALEVALKVLQGQSVPHNLFIPTTVTVTKGDETASIKADMPAESYARLDKPGDLILSTGIPNYDPKTFKADYPR